jgi:hypothetical protein
MGEWLGINYRTESPGKLKEACEYSGGTPETISPSVLAYGYNQADAWKDCEQHLEKLSPSPVSLKSLDCLFED